jgi:hypothetical protein
MINVQVVKIPNFAGFSKAFDGKKKDFYEAAMLQIVRDIVEGIKAGKDATGAGFPSLEPETITKKGHSQPLIDKGLLSDEFTYQRLNKWRVNSGEVTIKPRTRSRPSDRGGKESDAPRDEVGRHLQIDGVDSKRGKKYFRFFGITDDSSKTIMALIDEIVTECLEGM